MPPLTRATELIRENPVKGYSFCSKIRSIPSILASFYVRREPLRFHSRISLSQRNLGKDLSPTLILPIKRHFKASKLPSSNQRSRYSFRFPVKSFELIDYVFTETSDGRADQQRAFYFPKAQDTWSGKPQRCCYFSPYNLSTEGWYRKYGYTTGNYDYITILFRI